MVCSLTSSDFSTFKPEEILQGTVVLSFCAVSPLDKSSPDAEPYVPFYAFSKESILAYKTLQGDSRDESQKGSWHDNFQLLGANLPTVLPLRLFYNEKGTLKNTGDKIRIIFNNKQLELTCDIQHCSYKESLTSDEFSYSFHAGIIGDGWNQLKGEDFAARLERKIDKAISSENKFFSCETLQKTIEMAKSLAQSGNFFELDMKTINSYVKRTARLVQRATQEENKQSCKTNSVR